MDKKNIFLTFIDKFTNLPLWIKEVLFLHLKADLDNYVLNARNIVLDKNDLYQYCLPNITYIGKKELASRANNHNENIYKFLEGASQGLNILEITLNNYWTLEETAILNIQCIEKEYVSPPSTTNTKTMALYLSGKIRIGEYFKRVGQVNVDQLDTAIRKQKELEAAGQKVGMATVMINLGLITDEDSKIVLYIKDESKKRFIFNTDILGKNAVVAAPQGGGSSQELVEKLTRENNSLRNKLKAIAEILQK